MSAIGAVDSAAGHAINQCGDARLNRPVTRARDQSTPNNRRGRHHVRGEKINASVAIPAHTIIAVRPMRRSRGSASTYRYFKTRFAVR